MNNPINQSSRKKTRKLNRKLGKSEIHQRKYGSTQVPQTIPNKQNIKIHNNLEKVKSKKRKKSNKLFEEKGAKIPTNIIQCSGDDNDKLTIERFSKILAIPSLGKNRYSIFKEDGLEELLEICEGDIEDKTNSEDEQVNPSPEKIIKPSSKTREKVSKNGFDIIMGKLNAAINRLSVKTAPWVAVQIDEILILCKDKNASYFVAKSILDRILSHSDIFHEQVIIDVVTVLLHIFSSSGFVFLKQLISAVSHRFLTSFSIETDENSAKCHVSHSLLLFLSASAHFKIISENYMIELLEKICEDLTEKTLESLILVLKWLGSSLMSDHSTEISNIVQSVDSRIAGNKSEKHFSRFCFFTELINSIAKNQSSYDDLPEFGYFVSISFFSQPTKPKKVIIDESLSQILSSYPILSDPCVHNLDSLAGFKFSDKLLQAAKAQNFHSDVQKTVFCLLMSSEDFLNGFEKLRRLAINEKVENEIVFVIVHCCLREKCYNPYYFHVLNSLFELKRSFLIRFKFILWDQIEAMDSGSCCYDNLARLVSHLVCKRHMSVVTVLKNIDFLNLSDLHIQFIKLFIISVLTTEKKASAFGVIAKKENLAGLRQCMLSFVKNYLSDEKDKSIASLILILNKLLLCQ